MRLFTRVLAWSGLTGLIAATAAAPALADPGGTLDCSVSGQAVTNPPVQLIGGAGTYDFDAGPASGGLSCFAANTVGDWGLVTISLVGRGIYTNTVCGTGTADSTGDTITNVLVRSGTAGIGPWVVAQQDDLDYHIQFAAMHGTLTFTSGAGNATGGGPIQITDPTPGNAAPPDCTADFQVEGSFAASLPAE